MDFAIAGFVIGGLIVLAGVAIRDIGPRLRPRIVPRIEVPDESLRSQWNRFCIAAGSLVSFGGMTMVLSTVVAIAADVSDGTGRAMVMATGVVATACIALSALVVTPHYRNGGYVRRRLAPAAVESASIIPVPTVLVPPDDLFDAVSQPESEPPTISPQPKVTDEPVPALAAQEPVSIEAERPAPHTVEKEPVPDPEDLPGTLEELEPVPEVAAEPEDLTRAEREPVARPLPASLERYERSTGGRHESAPLLNGLPDYADDELPAWNAPAPTASPVSDQSSIQTAASRDPEIPDFPPPSTPKRPVPGAAGFQSSLLADLDHPGTEEELGTSFQSSLLRELTRESSRGPAPRDVVLDESSVGERGERVRPPDRQGDETS